MIIALFANTSKKQSVDIAKGVCDFFNRHGVTIVAEDNEAAGYGAKPLSSVPSKEISFIISVGGDGTILRLVHHHPEIDAPILGINMGSLGFMADIPINEIYPSLKNLLDGHYKVETRFVMDGRTKDNKDFAVNEIVVHRARNPSLIDLAIFVDDRYLNTFSADGIIVSTPSGSTAYSLSAGGPILVPELNAFVITPICPHTISNKPIVLLPESKIRIEYQSTHEPVEVTYDGFPISFIATGESVHIERSKRRFSLVSMPNHDYYFTLRTKLGWTGKLGGNSGGEAS